MLKSNEKQLILVLKKDKKETMKNNSFLFRRKIKKPRIWHWKYRFEVHILVVWFLVLYIAGVFLAFASPSSISQLF